MNFDLNLVMPEVFDIGHVVLAALCVITLLFVISMCWSKSCKATVSGEEQGTEQDSQKTSAEKKQQTSIVQLKEMDGNGALHLLSIFQNEGRLVDFIREDVAQFTDEEIGAAARVVHKGLRKAFDEHFTAEPVLAQEEGERVSIEAGFQPQEIQLLGNVTGDGPYQGILVHQGWRVTDVRLPKTVEGRNSHILASAQVEL